MIILGLGSNIGDRLEHLRKAVSAIKALDNVQVLKLSPLYASDALLPDNAPTDWDQPYLNLALSCKTSLSPFELLDKLKEIEWAIGRKPEVRHWGPRILDIDILVFHNELIQTERLSIPHHSLLERPFSLWPLCDLAPHWQYPHKGPEQGLTAAELVEKFGSRFTGNAPQRTWQLYQQIEGPVLVGVLNITPNSFSDGNAYTTTDNAIEQALSLVESGAEIIDIGAEATSPRAAPLDPETEWQRLQPILLALKEAEDDFMLPPKISIDTYHPEVARRALNVGIHWLNDVTGFANPEMRELVQGASLHCVMMHSLTVPVDKTETLSRKEDALQQVLAWGKTQSELMQQAGIAKERIIFDPGIGFGKTAEQSWHLIRHASKLNSLGMPVMIGHSRKSFYSLFTSYPPQERDIETLVTSYALRDSGVAYLRVHNVEASARALKLRAALSE